MKPTTPLLIALIGLSACAQAPTSPRVTRAPSRVHELCATIAWQDSGSGRAINSSVFSHKNEPSLTRLAYETGAGPQASSSAAIAELEQPFHSPQSINLALQVRREYGKARTQEMEKWVQSHLAVEVHSCPLQ